MSKKRLLRDFSCNTNEPALKRQKLTTYFAHKLDNIQYEQIFDAIDNSQIIKSFCVTHSISRNIAQYATGQFKPCVNNECKNDVVILNEDSATYNNNHKNCIKVGYKWCGSGKLFCSDCMHLATECNCEHCHTNQHTCLIFSENKCASCDTPMTYSYEPDNEFDNEFNNECNRPICLRQESDHCSKCNNKYCFDCDAIQYCDSCESAFCSDCEGIDDNGYCDQCRDETERVCRKCNVKYPLLYKGNKELKNRDLHCEMVKCNIDKCNVFVCSNCDENKRNGKKYFCKDFGCNMKYFGRELPCIFNAYFCNEHVPNQAFCDDDHKTKIDIVCKSAAFRRLLKYKITL